MNDTTIQQLNELNARFYQDQAQSWLASRQYAWPSWEEFRQRSRLTQNQITTVADIGCGTGRFAHFVAENWAVAEYTGYDLSPELLRYAQLDEPLALPCRWIKLDIVASLLSSQAVLTQSFDLITVFGVMHHLPSQHLRQQFLQQLAAHLNPGGEIWLTWWIPQRLGVRFPKVLDSAITAQQLGIDSAQLEAGDVFLGWKDTAAVRYVHWLSQDEEQEFRDDSQVAIAHEWTQTTPGERGNLCWLLQA